MRYFFVLTLILFCQTGVSNATTLPEDETAVRILGYFMVGRDDVPQANVTIEQFKTHLDILDNDRYNVIPLDDMHQTTAAKNVAITFDGGEKSILTAAAPLLEKYKFPYTVFVSTERLDADDTRYLNWKDLETLNKSGLMSIGLHPHTYTNLTYDTPKQFRKIINNATARLRDQDIDIKHFSFPFGEYNQQYLDVLKDYNFKALFGQQSSVAYAHDDKAVLPRFMMTEDYADVERFKMVVDSMPFPTTDNSSNSMVINSGELSIGFSVSQSIEKDLDRLTCFASNQNKPEITILGQRVELRLNVPATSDRFRVNCTLPAFQENEEKTNTWRWLGFLFQVNDASLNTAKN